MSKRKGGAFALMTVLAAAVSASANTGIVSKVLAGDRIQFGESFVARLTGIAAPALNEALGDEVYHFAKRELEGRMVKLFTWTTDNTAKGIVYDENGQAFVQIFYGPAVSVSFNEVLLKKGYARVDPKRLPNELRHYLDLEREARDKGLGIWKNRKAGHPDSGKTGMTARPGTA